MAFHSVLFEEPHPAIVGGKAEVPSFFHDLNLDQIVDTITADFKDYELTPFYYTRLNDLDAVAYRQEIMRDLDAQEPMQAIESFSEKMREMRVHLDQAKQLHYYKYAMERRFLGAVEVYCEAVERLLENLRALDLNSRGLRAFREYLTGYVAAVSFHTLVEETHCLKSDLSAIRYSLLIKDGSVTVRNYEEESDYSTSVEETFAKFASRTINNYWVEVPRWDGMNHIEAQIQDRVALLHPSTFRVLETFCTAHTEFLDKKISEFDREIQFYVAYLRHARKLRDLGLAFCEPQLSSESKEVEGHDCFDLALASKFMDKKDRVICNDFFLRGSERIFVVSGPNQGGKTTFARTFGQLHYLASLGCPVPGKGVRLFFCDKIFTHFEREESAKNLRGKLQDDLVRIREILEEATPDSIMIMNEIFSSTTLKDAVYLSKKIIEKMSEMDLLGVCVTFLDELASFNEKTVSVVSTVDPKNPAVRTFRLERKPADGLAYALAIAEKYRVTYDCLKERIQA